MGVGKTTLGKKVSKVLHIPFIDSDLSIEKKTGLRISEIFKNHGEQYFRALEKEFLNELSTNECIISCGGGMPCFNNNIDNMKKKGHVIYLQASVPFLLNRIKNSKKERPLAPNNDDDLKLKIEQLIHQRAKIYEDANQIINIETENREEILINFCKKILNK